jgi:CO/xanthine dehydrogenase FAD-binding subunit
LRCARSDLLPALLTLDATVILANQGGTRRIALADYLAEPAQSTELITAVELERAPSGTCFLRMSPRQSLAPAIANVAVFLRPTPDVERWDHVRIALGGMAGVAIRSRRAEQILAAAPCADEETMRAAATAAQDDSTPQSDSWASQWYRRQIVGVLVRRALETAGASART